MKYHVLYVSRPKAALAAIKKKVTNSNPHVALYALLVRNNGTIVNKNHLVEFLI